MPQNNEDKKHPITGCRADQLFGDWLIEGSRLDTLVEVAWKIVADPTSLRHQAEKSQQMREEEAAKPPYIVKDGIALLQISGPMTKHPTSFQELFGGTSSLVTQQKLAMIRKEYTQGSVRGLLIEFDSGGGTAAGTPELAAAIRKTAAIMPVLGHAQDVSASASLWCMSQCSYVTAGSGAQVGSLGTMCQLLDTTGTEREKYSGKPIVITSSPLKGIGYGPLTDAQKEELQRSVNVANEVFKSEVKTGRGMTDDQIKEAATARVYCGAEAIPIGLVDAMCSTTDEAYEKLQEIMRSGTVTRSTGLVQKFKPASTAVSPPRSRVMLTAEQLTQARSLPGAENLTAENADSTLLSIATKQRTDITDLQSKIPAPVDQNVAKGHARVLHREVDLLAKQGNILPEQAKSLKDLFMKEDKPNVSLVMPNTDGVSMANSVLSVLETNKPNGIVGERTSGQPVQKQEPGDDPTKKAISVARQNELRAKAGLPLLAESGK
jgi:ClpP class serine protease